MAFQDIPKSLVDSVSSVLMNEKKGDKEEYQKFFQSALKKFGVDSPSELKGDKEKEFYDYVDKNWKSDAEEKGVSEETIEEAKSEKPFISAMKDKSYAVNIDGVPNDFMKGGFNAQIKYNKDIKDFKSSAKKVYVDAKGKDTVKAVQKWAKENPGVQFYASWKSDSSGYKDDSVELYIKEDVDLEENVSMKIMKAVKSAKSSGPWSVVAIKNKKVIAQELVKVRDQLPATFKVMKKENPGAYISIEDDQINKRLFVEEVKYPHMMYDPESGKEVEVKDEEEHNKYAEKGWTHEKPKMDEAKDEYVLYMDSKKKVKKEKIVRTSNDELILGNGDTVDILDMVDTEKKIKTKGDWTMAEWVSEEDAEVVLESKFYKPQVNKSQESIVFMNDAEAKEAERYLGKKGIKVTRKAKKVTFGSSEDFQDAVSMVTESAESLTEGVDDPGIFKAIFLAGGPGSGKSFVVKKSGIVALGFKVVNSDSHFERALEAAGKLDDPIDIDDPEVIKLRQGAKALSKKQQIMWLEGRLGLVIDGTGKDFKKVSGQVKKLKELGYDVAMIFVNTDLETAKERNKMRQRSLPDDLVEPAWKEVQNNIGKFQNLFGQNFMVADNSEGVPTDKILLQAFKKFMRWAKTPPKSPIAQKWIQKQMGMREAKKLQEATATIKLDRGSSMEITSIVKNVADRLERQVSKNSGKPGLVRDKLYDALIGELMDRKLKFTNVNEETITEEGFDVPKESELEEDWTQYDEDVFAEELEMIEELIEQGLSEEESIDLVTSQISEEVDSDEEDDDDDEDYEDGYDDGYKDGYEDAEEEEDDDEEIDEKRMSQAAKRKAAIYRKKNKVKLARYRKIRARKLKSGSIKVKKSKSRAIKKARRKPGISEGLEENFATALANVGRFIKKDVQRTAVDIRNLRRAKQMHPDDVSELEDTAIKVARLTVDLRNTGGIFTKRHARVFSDIIKKVKQLAKSPTKVEKEKYAESTDLDCLNVLTNSIIEMSESIVSFEEDYDMLSEPAVSQSQQKLMAMALAYKRGEMSDKDASDKVKELAKDMSEKDLEDFAKTDIKDLPKKA
jgi:dephospho-CoA kinase/uncharacterized protein YoaH (UPF0181 family)